MENTTRNIRDTLACFYLVLIINLFYINICVCAFSVSSVSISEKVKFTKTELDDIVRMGRSFPFFAKNDYRNDLGKSVLLC